MTWSYELLGLVSGALGLSVAVPQLVRVLRADSHEGVSILTWIISLGNFAIWGAYGLRYDSPSQLVTNALACVLTVALVFVLVRQARGAVWAAVVAGGTVAGFASVGYFTPVWLMTGVLFSMVASGKVPQMVASVRSYARRRRTVVSKTTYVLMLASSFGWITYGSLTGLWHNIVASSFTVFASVFILFFETRTRDGDAGDAGEPHTVEQ